MDNYTTDELQEARRPIASLISKSEKVQQKLASGTWQHTMLQDNLKALQIASALLNKETTDTDNFTQDDLQEALRTFVSMISKTEKNHGTTLAHNDVSRVFNRCKSQRYSCVSSVSYPGRYAAFCRWWGDSAAQERWFADTSGTYESEVVSCQEYEETGIIIDHTTIHSKHNSQESTFRMMVTYVFRKEGDQWRLTFVPRLPENICALTGGVTHDEPFGCAFEQSNTGFSIFWLARLGFTGQLAVSNTACARSPEDNPGHEGGSRRVLRQVMWLQAGSRKAAFPRPVHPRVTTGYPPKQTLTNH